MEPFEGDSSPRLSMRQKSALKRRITREHNSNFRAGYININEQYLHKTGIRGRKRYFLYCLVVLLCLIAVVNGLLTAGVIYFLRITPQYGMEMIEYIPDNDLIRILGKAVFDTVETYGRIGSRANKDLYIDGRNNSVVITGTSSNTKTSVLTVDPDSISFDNTDSFIIQDSTTGFDMFSTKPDSVMSLDGDIKNLRANEVYLYNISNIPSIPNLIVESLGGEVNLTGSEGVELSSTYNNISFTSQNNNILLESEHGSLILDAASFIRLNVDHLPTVTNPSSQGPVTFKLCVCVPQGKLFAIAVTGKGIGCDNAGGDGDPCK